MKKDTKEALFLKKKQEFLNRIRETRVRKGWSLYRMAQETGIDRTYLLRIERGEISLGLNNLIYICDALDLDISLSPKDT